MRRTRYFIQNSNHNAVVIRNAFIILNSDYNAVFVRNAFIKLNSDFSAVVIIDVVNLYSNFRRCCYNKCLGKSK